MVCAKAAGSNVMVPMPRRTLVDGCRYCDERMHRAAFVPAPVWARDIGGGAVYFATVWKGGSGRNVVTGMANLSITDDVGSKKLAGGLNKPNGVYPQFVGGTPC